jgi:hypothetical protein
LRVFTGSYSGSQALSREMESYPYLELELEQGAALVGRAREFLKEQHVLRLLSSGSPASSASSGPGDASTS